MKVEKTVICVFLIITTILSNVTTQDQTNKLKSISISHQEASSFLKSTRLKEKRNNDEQFSRQKMFVPLMHVEGIDSERLVLEDF